MSGPHDNDRCVSCGTTQDRHTSDCRFGATPPSAEERGGRIERIAVVRWLRHLGYESLARTLEAHGPLIASPAGAHEEGT